MKQYFAFLRGINVRGKNKVPMAELKASLEALGLSEVKTWLNSGNVCFSSEAAAETLTEQMEAMIKEHFGAEIPVFVIAKEDLVEILLHAPGWWDKGDEAIYDNLIFILPPAAASDVQNEIGAPKEGIEWIEPCRNVVFWSFVRAEYQKTNWWSKTASAHVAGNLTIRTANTVRKMVALSSHGEP